MPPKKKHKISIAAAALIVALIVYGAFKGSVKESSPANGFDNPILSSGQPNSGTELPRRAPSP
jgi:hypothetical protein